MAGVAGSRGGERAVAGGIGSGNGGGDGRESEDCREDERGRGDGEGGGEAAAVIVVVVVFVYVIIRGNYGLGAVCSAGGGASGHAGSRADTEPCLGATAIEGAGE